MKKIENKCMLITYPDSMGGNLPALSRVLEAHFPGVFGGVHILPFFPSSGDRGFAVTSYDEVDPRFGTWEDIDELGSRYYLMADFMLNHISVRSEEFRDYMERGDASPFQDMFIHWDRFWKNGEPTEEELNALYMRSLRKKNGPCLEVCRADGKTVRLWNTFSAEQLDIDPFAKPTRDYYRRNLGIISAHVPLVRFDAFAYASKVPGSSCFFVEPRIWEVLEAGMEPLRETGTEMLPEIHENYTIQMKMAEKGYWVYDFALPMLLLHGLFEGRSDRLLHWLQICPRKQFTTLDNHDGIGVVDVAGLLSEEEIDRTVRQMEENTKDVWSFIHLPPVVRIPGKPVRRYQMPGAFYSILNCEDRAYLLARAVQLFAPGIPQVYYVGLLAGTSDIEAGKTNPDPRTFNRHNYSEAEIAAAVENPVLQKLYEMMRLRNTCRAFSGEFACSGAEGKLQLRWRLENTEVRLDADLVTRAFTITELTDGQQLLRFCQE